MNTRVLLLELLSLFIAVLGQQACNQAACLVNPCNLAGCPANPTATCVPDYCNGSCDYYFVDANKNKVDCTLTCEGKCDPKLLLTIKPAPCPNANATPFWACRKSLTGACVWNNQCAGTCCLSQFGLDCNASSIYNGDWCPAGTSCCLSSDAFGGAGAKSFSCCGGGYQCTAPSTPTRGGSTCKPVDLCSAVKCELGSACVVVNNVATCKSIILPPSDPCMTLECTQGTCVSMNGQAKCVPVSGKPGQCPTVTPGNTGVCGGISVCFTDYDCPLAQKCCNNGCGGLCTDPVSSGTVKPGTCPTAPSGVTSAVCYEACSSDSDCLGDLKCCGASCSKRCVLPQDKVCTNCGIRPMIPAHDCGDGTFADYVCNKDTCTWEFKDCNCNCNYSAYTQSTAVDTASSLLPGTDIATQLPTCLVAVASFSSDVKTAATASISTTATTSTTSTSRVQTCFGKGGCQKIGTKCVPYLSCESCVPTLPPPKCIRAGCQREKCVAPDAAITMECAQPSYQFECLKKAVCDVDSSGTCGWQKTDAYVQCMKDPVQGTKDCASLDACSCATNSSCLWCLSGVKVLPTASSVNPVDVPLGVCIQKTERNKCLAPKAIGGLAGKMVDAFACDPSSSPAVDVEFTEALEKKSLVQINAKISEQLQKDSTLGVKISLQSLFNPVAADVPDGKGVFRSVVTISPKPSSEKIGKICDVIGLCVFDNTAFSASSCQFSEVVDDSGSAAGSVKRQTSSSSGTYLYQAVGTVTTSSGSFGLTFSVFGALSTLVAMLM